MWRRDLGAWTPADRGQRAVSDPLLGVLVAKAERPFFVSLCFGTSVLASESLAAGEDRLTFTLDPRALGEEVATLRLRVLDASGEPLPRAEVSLSFYPASDERVHVGELSPAGILERAGLRPGTCRVRARTEDAELETDVTLVPGLNDLGELRLERTFALQGLVVDARGNPLRGEADGGRRDVVVECLCRHPITGELVSAYGVSTVDAEGAFAGDLEAGEYVLRVRGRWVSPNTVVVVPGEPVELTAVPPTPLILRLDAGDWSGFGFGIFDAADRPVAQGTLRGTAPLQLGLPPGSYELRLLDAAGVVRSETRFELERDECTLNVRL